MGLSKINGKTKYESIHRLVAIAFIPNPENKSQVNHIDGDKKNNCIDNLEWNTREENYHHSVKTGLRFPTLTGNRPVIKYSKEGIYIKEYPSAKFAGKDINVKSKNIWDAAKGVQSTAGGFRWAFKDRVVPVQIR